MFPRQPETETDHRFLELGARWREGTMFESSLHNICAHPDYAALAAMGEEIVPIILHQVANEPWVGWFALLGEITGETPAESEQTMQGAADRWVEWGRARYGEDGF